MTKKKNNIFLEDIAYGIYDRPGPMGKIADEEEASTVHPDVPVSPSPQMSTQVSVDRPPIEDEDYTPGSVEELSRAASAIAQLTPSKSVEFFYRHLHKLLDDATDKANKVELDSLEVEKDEKEDEKEVKEAFIRRTIRKALIEIISPEDEKEFDEYRHGASDPEPEAEKEGPSDGINLEDLAKEFGYAGPPGVRQEIDRLTDRMQYFTTKIKPEDLDALVDYAVGEYIDALAASDLLDPEDIEDLQKAPRVVRDLDSFRFFFVGSFVLPAYRAVVRDATKKVKAEIDQLGIPKELQQTVFHQITGATSRNPALIKKKVAILVSKGKLSSEEASGLEEKIRVSRLALESASEYSDDLVQRALDRWQSTGKKDRIVMIRQAMEQTASNV
tara:strand:- start:1289 stop:2449 length:1161 start_codon:yes stop_codon:yes gene_type:complete